MKPTLRTSLVLALSVSSLVACAVAPDDASSTRKEAARTEAVAPSGPGAEPVEPGPEPAAVPGITSERPCGVYTTAHVPGAAGEALTVCVLPSGRELVAVTSDVEEAPEASRPRCAVDVFVKKAAPGVPVPRKLVDNCVRKTGVTPFTAGREVVDRAVFVEVPVATSLSPKSVTVTNGSGTAFCGASGDQSFQQSQCPSVTCGGWDPDECASACIPQLWGASQRTCPEGDSAVETVASCGGSTRFRALWREGSGDSWVTVHEDYVLANRYQKVYVVDGDSWADADMRFKAESAAGAGHRHAFRCLDY